MTQEKAWDRGEDPTLPGAKEPGTGVSATPGVMNAWLRWVRIPRVSGIDCVQVLRREGYAVRRNRSPGCLVLEGEKGTLIEVPMSERLDPDVLIAIFVRAGIRPERVLELLDESPGL